MIYTFYSYKGGVGRSMTLANVGELLYQAGLNVLLVDWDLEAPGLERFFAVDAEEITRHPGVMDMLLDCKHQITQDWSAKAEELPFKKPCELTIDLHPDSVKGRLRLLTAGQRDRANFTRYANAVLTFDWKDFYDNWEGEAYLEWVRQQFLEMADVVLIDSRTGITEMGGVCSYQFADVVVMFCGTSRQNLEGTVQMVADLKSHAVEEARGRPLEVVMVPARVDKESGVGDEFKRDFLQEFAKYTPEIFKRDSDFFWQLTIPYATVCAYKEMIVTSESSVGSEDVYKAFARLTSVIARLAPEGSKTRRAMPEAHITIGGVSAVGAVVAGNIVVVHGDVVHGDRLGSRESVDPAVLHTSYLSHLFESVSQISLAGVDLNAARESSTQTRLALAALYTALVTQQTEGPRLRKAVPDLKTQRLSAVALLDRESRLALLGDPGSGKSTFVNFVAMCLAGEALGRTDANLALMTMSLPQEDVRPRVADEKPAPQPWRHGALLPVRVVLRDFAARGLPAAGQPATSDHLWRFIVAELGESLAEYAPYLKRALRETGGLVLLDGLDEVPEADERRIQVKQAVQGFGADFPRCRLVVTSRTYAYQRQDWRLPGFGEAVLAPFGPAQINRFVDGWYAHLAAVRGLNREDAQGRAALLKEAIRRSDRLAELAEHPLLLTLMASLHAWRGGNLPERREELYADTVDLLLDQWESPKLVRGLGGRPVMAEPSLSEWLEVDRVGVRKLLEQLAFEAHRDQPDLTGTADISEDRLVIGLVDLAANPDVRPIRLIEYMRDRAGVLVERGVRVYTFPHRTFQEYLAASHLTGADFPDDVAALVLADGQRWREVTLLAGAKAARGAAAAAWNLAEALCCRAVGAQPKGAEYLAALLAGQTLIENEALHSISERNRPKAACIQEWLHAIAERGALLPIDRAAAGDALALFGDGRPGVGLRSDGVPDIAWCGVPAGEFIMGSQDGRLTIFGEERPQHRLALPAYHISKYPITNAQFEAFVRDGGYADTWRRCWTQAGWHWKGKRNAPDKMGGAYDLPNHPVVLITWYEAAAFCSWLSRKLGLIVALPSEAQWEKAARGTDGRIYPWGEKITPDHANWADTGIGTTTAVGIFPKGASPSGALDMSGNVWEWTRTLWGRDHSESSFNYAATDGREDLNAPDGMPRVLRGGALDSSARRVRCAVRYRYAPRNCDRFIGFRVCVVEQ